VRIGYRRPTSTLTGASVSRIGNVLKVPDLRNKILFTLFILVVYRFGCYLPVPGVDQNAVNAIEDQARQGGVLAFLQLFSGRALTQFSLFALGIMPYITSSIIMQILTVVIPKLQDWQQEGATGQRKITQWTRYLTIGIAVLQSTGLVFLFHNGGGGLVGGSNNLDLVPIFTPLRVSLIVTTFTAGTALLMWMGELITTRGIGNGMSLIIFMSVVSGLPAAFSAVYAAGSWKLVVFAAFFLVLLGFIVYIELGQRRIPVQFAKRVVGRKMYAGQSTYIPLKVNQAGVVPIIFASSVMLLPVLLTNVIGSDRGWRRSLTEWVDRNLVSSQGLLYIVVFALLIIAFAYFYNSIAFDPIRQADQIRRQGGFIPGIRPGPQTESYLARVVNRITLPGALFVAFIAILPYIVLWVGDVQSFPFAGTTVLIAVGVALELMRQVDSQLMLRNYEGFLK
jgi:preprotein translocase subunit SecY